MPRIIRVPIKIEVFEKSSGKLVDSTRTRLRHALPAILDGFDGLYSTSEYTFLCTIEYNKKNDSWTKFEFTSQKDFKRQLDVALEPELLAHIKDTELSDPSNFKKARR